MNTYASRAAPLKRSLNIATTSLTASRSAA
jgi:hypothetical protein